jgi:hypothetical protein
MKYAIINSENVVENIIEANQSFAEALATRKNCIAVPSDIAGIGASYNPDTGVISPKPDDAGFVAIKGALAGEIASLNQKYNLLNLSITDSVASAIPKLLAVGALKDEVVYLKMLYDTVKEVQAQ